LRTAASNLLTIAEAESWAGQFTEAGITAVWLKGVPLSLSVYPDPAVRPMGDIDLLVPCAQLRQALALVESKTGSAPATLAEDSAMHAVFQVGGDGQVRMELQWSLLDVAGSRLGADVGWFLGQQRGMKSRCA